MNELQHLLDALDAVDEIMVLEMEAAEINLLVLASAAEVRAHLISLKPMAIGRERIEAAKLPDIRPEPKRKPKPKPKRTERKMSAAERRSLGTPCPACQAKAEEMCFALKRGRPGDGGRVEPNRHSVFPHQERVEKDKALWSNQTATQPPIQENVDAQSTTHLP